MTRYFITMMFEFLVIIIVVSFFFVRKNTNKAYQASYSQLLALGGSYQEPEAKVLGEMITPTTIPLVTSILNLETVPINTVHQALDLNLKKEKYIVAVYGDSLEDTMGERLEYLEKALKKKYKTTNFDLYNYGIGSQNAQEGLFRLENTFDYQDRNYLPLTEINPDVLIIGSYAYNPFYPHSLQKHTEYLTALLKKAKSITGNVYLLAEIAPLKDKFGQGPGGVNWSSIDSYLQATNIMALLENAIRVAENMEIPVIDAYTVSQFKEDKSGRAEYVNTYDHIHPSVLGHQFMAELIVERVNFDY